jgi:hypothetical protein
LWFIRTATDFTGGSFDVSEIVSAGDSIEMLYLPALESVSIELMVYDLH